MSAYGLYVGGQCRCKCPDLSEGRGIFLSGDQMFNRQIKGMSFFSFLLFRSKLGLFQSRISLQKASVKVSLTHRGTGAASGAPGALVGDVTSVVCAVLSVKS